MSIEEYMSDPMNSIGYALKQAQHAMRIRMDAQLREYGLSASKYAVLAALENVEGLSNADLARLAFVTPQTMQGILSLMEKDQIIKRVPHETNKRIQATYLTNKARRILVEAHKIAMESEQAAIDAISPDDPEKFKKQLLKCVESLRKEIKKN